MDLYPSYIVYSLSISALLNSHFALLPTVALRFTFTATPVNWTTVQLNFTAPDNMQTGIYHHFNLTIRRRNQSAVRSVPVSAGSLVHLLPGFVGLNNYTLTGVPWTLEGPGKEFQVSVAMPEGGECACVGHLAFESAVAA